LGAGNSDRVDILEHFDHYIHKTGVGIGTNHQRDPARGHRKYPSGGYVLVIYLQWIFLIDIIIVDS
jgi:hypothetical protein